MPGLCFWGGVREEVQHLLDADHLPAGGPCLQLFQNSGDKAVASETGVRQPVAPLSREEWRGGPACTADPMPPFRPA